MKIIYFMECVILLVVLIYPWQMSYIIQEKSQETQMYNFLSVSLPIHTLGG